MPHGVVVAAPASGSGKTTITLALLRHLRSTGSRVVSAKVGPDFIDPAFHRAASGRACLNLDLWAMRASTFDSILERHSPHADLVICEGVMGLFDGATGIDGSSAELAATLGWPVVLVVDAAAMGASAGAIVHGFASFHADVTVSGVIFNRVAGRAHESMLTDACGDLEVAVLGCVPHHADLSLPERHLGLVQAGEHPDLDRFLDAAAARVARHVDCERLVALARPSRPAPGGTHHPVPPLGQRIWAARDTAFAFTYESLLDDWHRGGAGIRTFSPLADEAPGTDADAVYLPGGYPELHAGRLAGNRRFLDGLRAAAGRGATVYGECGGFMVLGEALVDTDGERHQMADLLPSVTSFAEPRLTLGYRRVQLLADSPLGRAGERYRGHEFHYASVARERVVDRLFACRGASDRPLADIGNRRGNVMGSFVHLIDRE